MAITATGKFRKVRMKDLENKYGMYRGQGKITIDDKEIVLEGSHVKSMGVRWGIAILIILIAAPFFKTGPGGAIILGGIPIYLLVEYMLLTKENVRMQRDEFKKFVSDPKKQLVGIEFIGPNWTSPAIMKTDRYNEVVEALSQFAASKENHTVTSDRPAEVGVKMTTQEKTVEPGNTSVLAAQTGSVAVLHAEGKSITGGATQAWKITLSDNSAVFKQINSSVEIAVPHQEVSSFLSLTNSGIAGHNVILHQGQVKHRMFLNQQNINRFGEWLGSDNIRALGERSAGLQFASVIPVTIGISFAIGIIRASMYSKMSMIFKSVTDPYVVGIALLLSLIFHIARWWFKLAGNKRG